MQRIGLHTLRNTQRLQPFTSRFIAPTFTPYVSQLQQPQRTFASRREMEQRPVVRRDFGVVAEFVPYTPDKIPSPFSDFRRWFYAKKRNFRNSVETFFYNALIKHKMEFEKWNPREFTNFAERAYGAMNEAFAKGDKKLLEEICADSMYATLKNSIKHRPAGTYVWKLHDNIEPPRIVSVRCLAEGYGRGGFSLGQVIVRLHTKQSMAVYDKRRLIGGDPNAPKELLEYIVFQRVISDPESTWRIYGKVNEKPILDEEKGNK
ncbi:uncharacterized protein VTP21DRAFT_6852 [Calcarisporiella thermophila]|uniref:uncharacterized protein n=1 Tax=Calcarisporiella thermophila TaxID=911321 RepID=UPI003742B87B